MKKLAKYNFAAALWSLLILALSMMPGTSIPKVGWQIFIQWDKLAHFLLYAVLAIFLSNLIAGRRGRIIWQDLFMVIAICSIYGATMEAMQYYFLSDRFFEIPDIIANIIGSIAGSVFV
ncbi:MAG: VanZ family protein, partial [Saprospiraceae bacterium]|nr:VanZ family protein [Saprospiraceae bacterium]